MCAKKTVTVDQDFLLSWSKRAVDRKEHVLYPYFFMDAVDDLIWICSQDIVEIDFIPVLIRAYGNIKRHL